MRLMISSVPGLVLALTLTAAPVLAESDKDTLCRERADLVVTAFNARKSGDSKRKVRRDMRAALDRTAADMLAEFVWSVPEEALTEEQIGAAGDAFFDQCKAL